MLQSTGIKNLLDAEKNAQARIDEARKQKNIRLKQAQNEAKTEIEAFRKTHEERYKKLEEEQLGNKAQLIDNSKKQTENHISSLETAYESNKSELLERIIELVCDIKAKAHDNVRIE